MRPRGFEFSFIGSIMLLFTGTMGFLMVKFPQFHGLKVAFTLLFLLNCLFFVRFREKGKKRLWDRVMDSKFFPRKLTLTNEGKFLLMISLGIGFAAVNTGSNLLYLLLAMLLSIITASGILSEISLRKVTWTIQPLGYAVRGEECVFPVRVRNQKRHFSSFSLEGELRFRGDPRTVQVPGAVLKLPPGGVDTLFQKVTFLDRGLCSLSSFSLSTRYPFSFFRKTWNHKLSGDILVLPRGDRDVEGLLPVLSRGLDEHSRKAGRGSEFYSVRQMQPGDEWRDVHWKQSAKHGRFVVKEYDALAGRRVYVRLSLQSPLVNPETGEQAIELAASLVRWLSHEGWDVGLLAPGTYVPIASGPTAVRSCFCALALLDLSSDLLDAGLASQLPALRPSDFVIDVGLDTLNVRVGQRVVGRE